MTTGTRTVVPPPPAREAEPPDTVATRATLLVAGAVAVAVGTAGLVAPEAFHTANGGAPVADVTVLSELRAAGAGVLAVGALLVAAVARPRLTGTALLVGGGLYLAYGGARVVGLVVDGSPGTGLLVAGAVELALGALCVGTWWRARGRRAAS